MPAPLKMKKAGPPAMSLEEGINLVGQPQIEEDVGQDTIRGVQYDDYGQQDFQRLLPAGLLLVLV